MAPCRLSQSRLSTIELNRGNRSFVSTPQTHGSEPFQIRPFQILPSLLLDDTEFGQIPSG